MNNKTLGFAGAGLLVVGLFLPVASVPFLGTVTLMSVGLNWLAFALLALAVLSAVMVARDRLDDLIWTGSATLVALLYMIAKLQYGISEMRSSMAADLKDNPFSGLAQSAMATVGLQWGWIVLLAAAGMLIYAAIQARKEREVGTFEVTDPGEHLVIVLSVLALLVTPIRDAWTSYGQHGVSGQASSQIAEAGDAAQADAALSGRTPPPSAEEATYMQTSLKVYDLEAKYHDSYEGRVPGVDFKIKNEGNRTLDQVTITVVFYDQQDKPIAEEEYYPVNVAGMNFGGNSGPLRPNYIWKQERGQFYAAKSVPDEWKVGKVSAKVTDIEFGPNS